MAAYPINEIFYSLQGEGAHAGQAATFVRFSGCNLKCPFCDTDHSAATPMSKEEIVAEVSRYRAPLVVLTGGEPSLFVDNDLVEALHEAGKYLAMETNGTNPVPEGIDWITLSPKFGMAEGGEDLRVQRADEIKVVYVGQDLGDYFELGQCSEDTKMYLQPCYVSDPAERQRNIEATVKCVKADPRWTLSAQLHRFLGIR